VNRGFFMHNRGRYFVQQLRAEGGDSEAPSVPANLAASDITTTTLTLTWDASTDNVEVVSYEVEQALDGGGFSWLATVAAPTVTLDVTGLDAGTAYRFRVRALDAAGNASAWGPDDVGLLVETVTPFTFVAPSFNGRVYGSIQDDDSFIFFGEFNQVTGVNGAFTRNRVCRVDADGNVDAWNPNANSVVYGGCIDGTWVYLAGAYTTIGGSGRPYLCRVDKSTGAVDTWNPVASTFVQGVYTDSRGVWAVAASAITYNGVQRNGLACLSKSTALLTSWDHARGASATAVYGAYFDASTAYIVGSFTGTFTGDTRTHAARLDLDTGLPTAFDPRPNAVISGGITVSGSSAYIAMGDGTAGWAGGSTRNDRCVRVDASTGALDAGWAPAVLTSCFSVTAVGADIILGLRRLATNSSANVGGSPRYGLAMVAQSDASLNAWDPGVRVSPEVSFSLEFVSKEQNSRGAMSSPLVVAGGTKILVFGRIDSVTTGADSVGTNCAVVDL
jgi:hypothetical protein